MSSQKKVSSGNTTPSGLAGLASPLNDQQINLLQQISDLSPQQLAWVVATLGIVAKCRAIRCHAYRSSGFGCGR